MFFKQSLLSVSPLVALVLAQDANYTWQAPSSTDLRGPCPMVNTLANHGYLPRDGVNVSLADLITGFSNAINLDESATILVGLKALDTSTTGNSSTFNLDDLDTHDILEHDGSLSRQDIYFGDDHTFNETIYDSFFAHFANVSTIDITAAAAARKARLEAAEAVNPEYDLTAELTVFSLIETALYLTVFGNGTSGTDVQAVKEWVDVMFREERLPFEEGWTRSESVLSAAGILLVQAAVAIASL